MTRADEDDAVRRLFEAGADTFGSAVGAMTGLVLSGAEGAVLGAFAGPTLAGGLKEIAARALGRRESARVALTYASAVSAMEELRLAGHQLRSDGFRAGARS